MFKQLTVFIENKPGRLAGVTDCLAEENINLHALSIADTTDFGLIRLIVSDPDRTKEILKARGFMVQTTNVAAVATGHSPGSLNKVLKQLEALDISIEFMYAFTSSIEGFDAIVVMKLSEQEKSVEKLRESGVKILGKEFLELLQN
ncbi:MAG: ACT domain-containing protein [Oscillospiraceae bacterium]|nr:ACT domain-containing protein [Oscillospiraceae bacterium]